MHLLRIVHVLLAGALAREISTVSDMGEQVPPKWRRAANFGPKEATNWPIWARFGLLLFGAVLRRGWGMDACSCDKLSFRGLSDGGAVAEHS